jgi:hypothetical protein
MTHGHSLWFLLVWACVVWYSTITIYVSVKGFLEIKSMLRDLKDRGQQHDTPHTDEARKH